MHGVKNVYHLLQAAVANIVYAFPSRGLTVIGVTGTDGKTTTTSLIYHILKSSGARVAAISTVGAYVDGKLHDTGFHVTTPSPFQIQKYIKYAKDSGVSYLILEVTSHALDQSRVFGIHFDIGLITNVSHEHLDYHKTYERYVRTKVKLLKMSDVAIVNRDDDAYEYISNIKHQISKLQIENKKLITYGLGSNAEVNPKTFELKTKMVGKFNQYNALAAIAACRELGLDEGEIKKSLATFIPPIGRQEVIYDKNFTVMIDFAHTPNSFSQVLPEAKNLARGRLIHVFGSAGERDASKRLLMGREAGKFDDVIILTAEDPRSESVEQINEQIITGIQNSKFSLRSEAGEILNSKQIQNTIFQIPDRRHAIEFAVGLAERGDIVLLTGKSHEKSMNYGRGEESWDEFEVAQKAIEKRSA